MKIYPLYEFPPNLEQLAQLLSEIEKVQPISKSDAAALVQKLYGKRKSRSEITIRNLRDLGVLSGMNNIMLSSETQLYMDMDKDLAQLLLYYIYKQPSLFQLCNDLFSIDNFMEIDNPVLLSIIYSMGYKSEKLATGREKIYAIKRLISCCISDSTLILENPFYNYKNYYEFIKVLQESYFHTSHERIGEPIPIVLLRDYVIKEHNYSIEQFQKYLNSLYTDILLSRNISFTTANVEFAGMGYYVINNKNYYFMKLLNYIIEEDTLF
ncbi:hypothetical protein ABE504_31485 [Paenibacillus oryzisoli]|uniref:hypothetical protein n=1 Tax=Paenibacillus oryzisoli TaxID=1850517 RepID=UPI003D29BBDD